MIAIDNIAPEQSRLKLYCRTPRTNFASIRKVMTVGGRISVSDSQFEDLRTLVAVAVGLDANFSDELEWPLSQQSSNAAVDAFSELPALQSGLIYYFDIASGIPQPGVKLYIMVRHYGPDDLILGQAIAGWMERHGRGGFCDAYLSMLQKLSPDSELSGKKGVQVYLSCMFKGSGELEITSYIAPRGFSPTSGLSPSAMSIPPRVSLRRRDS
ncbi:dimethylallyl tryptophan synthase GliD1 [Akanthomyces lecanii RCEF 1005]|uniref:Dimethylallyl tryptophan synthase GliD1 n=1 Tax=Akanthomyces lecanii RCEF 1005 TaxID=1081108 RepID=A0A168I3L4_CORDF|nr:dimethylallyl tryptophan synthase GliD1 [Akanthomyces lecanii RCEF 1005]